MKTLKDDPRSQHTCPYCEAKHNTALYAFAHWNDQFIVTCALCGKRYMFFKGHTYKMAQKRRSA